MKYGLQLYSVRDAAEKDYEMTLREVAAMGYEYVEPAGFFGHSAEPGSRNGLTNTALPFPVRIPASAISKMILPVR